jgi:hypothetical protein
VNDRQHPKANNSLNVTQQVAVASYTTKLLFKMHSQVRVTLRSMRDGLPGFQEAWNAWAQRGELPVSTWGLCSAAMPFCLCAFRCSVHNGHVMADVWLNWF